MYVGDHQFYLVLDYILHQRFSPLSHCQVVSWSEVVSWSFPLCWHLASTCRHVDVFIYVFFYPPVMKLLQRKRLALLRNNTNTSIVDAETQGPEGTQDLLEGSSWVFSSEEKSLVRNLWKSRWKIGKKFYGTHRICIFCRNTCFKLNLGLFVLQSYVKGPPIILRDVCLF